MEIVRRVSDMQSEAKRLRSEGKRVGFVPTMGYLHEGHASLMRIATQQCDILVTSIFVNPTQFGPGEDFGRYPRDLSRDEKLAKEAGTHILFHPEVRDMYPEGFQTYISTEHVASILEGNFRPQHFRGVATIVAKLFNIVMPNVAVFGQKDAQQVFVIRKMVQDLNIDIRIVVAPIVREADGLAMSSRNTYLMEKQRADALSLFRSLKLAEEMVMNGERAAGPVRRAMEGTLKKAGAPEIDYIAFLRPDTFVETENIHPPEVLVALAVRFGSTRLIDNIVIPVS